MWFLIFRVPKFTNTRFRSFDDVKIFIFLPSISISICAVNIIMSSVGSRYKVIMLRLFLIKNVLYYLSQINFYIFQNFSHVLYHWWLKFKDRWLKSIPGFTICPQR